MIADLFLREEAHGLERADDRMSSQETWLATISSFVSALKCAMTSHPDPETSRHKPVEQDGRPPPKARPANLGDPTPRTEIGQKRC
jgi:hypothetical protein